MLKSVYLDILMPVGEKGGVETVVNKVAAYLEKQGYLVRIVQFVWEGVYWVNEPIEFYPLLEGRGTYSLEQFVECYETFLTKHRMPDIILATTWPMMTLIAKMSVARLGKRCKIIAWLHGPLEKYVSAGYGGIECLKESDGIFVLNEKTKNIIDSYDEKDRVAIVNNPVNFERCSIHAENGWKQRKLLFVGRLSEEKRVDIILHALSCTKETWNLILIGDGEEENRLKALAKTLHIDRQVNFMGWKTNPWEYANGVSALVLASEYEGFPLVAIESLASGIPVISTPVDGISEVIKPGVNGFLYLDGDSKGLADILDAISLGKFPEVQPQVCRETVKDYEEKKALADFKEKLEDILDKISVIIPCYNVEKRITRCLESILSQTFWRNRIEIICVDDKSTDDTLKILYQYEKKYPQNILLIPLDKNGKQGNARNIGLLYASGDYITFVDADDAIAPEMFRSMYEKIIDSECDVVECAYKEVWSDSELFVEEKGDVEYLDMSNPEAKKNYILQYGWKTAPWGRMYRKEFLINNALNFLTDTYMEDIYFSERCMLCMHNYIRIPQTYYFYCTNEEGVMCNDAIADYYMDTAMVQIRTTQEVDRLGLLRDCREEFAYLHFSKAFAEPIRRMCVDERCFSRDNYKFLKESLFQFFPDFLDNPYVVNDKSREMELYKMLLEDNRIEQECDYKYMEILWKSFILV